MLFFKEKKDGLTVCLFIRCHFYFIPLLHYGGRFALGAPAFDG
jgi:hypothetical protein